MWRIVRCADNACQTAYHVVSAYWTAKNEILVSRDTDILRKTNFDNRMARAVAIMKLIQPGWSPPSF